MRCEIKAEATYEFRYATYRFTDATLSMHGCLASLYILNGLNPSTLA
jgi:hypothetical protein